MNNRKAILTTLGVAVVMLVMGVAIGSIAFPATKTQTVTNLSTQTAVMISRNSSSNYEIETEIILLQPYQVVLFPQCLTAALQTSTSTIYVIVPNQVADNHSSTV